MKRMALVGVTVLIGAFGFGLGSTAGAADYPPKANTEVTVAAKAATTPTDASPDAAQGAPLPFTGSDSAQLVWAGGALLLAGAALVGRGQRRAVRR
jgi:LPXTG-motif cell wall-anchored protein